MKKYVIQIHITLTIQTIWPNEEKRSKKRRGTGTMTHTITPVIDQTCAHINEAASNNLKSVSTRERENKHQQNLTNYITD